MTNGIKPDDIRVSHVMRISRHEMAAHPGRFSHMAEREMREAIAHFIQSERVETRTDEFFVEKRIELYVASPSQFWALVNAEAGKIALRYYGRSPITDMGNGA